MDKISEYISYEEAIKSQTATRKGIVNIPNDEQLQCMKIVAETCFEPLRTWYNKPLIVSSFFRSEELNKAIGGVKTSQHCEGKAIDIDTGSKEENIKIFEWAKVNLKYDQLINEYNFSWVHISFNLGKNRNQVLIIK
jgi:zinc D-Ala-D-Ala carboxypeptidase